MGEEDFPEAAINQAAGRLVGNTQRAEPDFKAETILENEVVSVPTENGGLLTHFGGELIARLYLGGTEGGAGVPKLPSQELHYTLLNRPKMAIIKT
jgi:hypothetical protein